MFFIPLRYLHGDRMISDTILLEHWLECLMVVPSDKGGCAAGRLHIRLEFSKS